MSRPFDLTITARAGKSHMRFLWRYLPRAHALLNTPLRELSVALVGDATMSALHEQFMSLSGPTDVLTFPMEFDARGRPLSGEVVVCVPQAVREGRKRGISASKELLLYALHGMLHLSGFDDRTDSAFQKMHRKEDQILTRLGLGPIFKPGPRMTNRGPAMHARKATRAANRRRLGA